jgi:D-alanyl-D-alanine carboxypeptidase (penicillin-binding protein 5/6)
MISRNIKFFLFSFFLCFAFFGLVNLFQQTLENFFLAQIVPQKEPVFITPEPKKPPLEINAQAVFSLKIDRLGKKEVLFEKEGEKILPIASLTKLMDAVVILEDKENYDLENTEIKISQKAAEQGDAPNEIANLKPGEKFKVKDLLKLALLYSSNDAAYALSEVIGTENFVAKMNEKAQSLGLKNTYFENPTGLDPLTEKDLERFNRSTAKDLVKLSQYILKEHPEIFEITIKEPEEKIENGIFDLFLPESEIIGGKTGFTETAGGCIVFVFKNKKGDTYFNVILGTKSEKERVEEMQKLVDWILNNNL